MHKIELIALDLDGTLFDEEKKITAITKHTLQEAIKEGVIVVPATGRPFAGIPQEIRAIEGLQYALTANGAAIYEMQMGRCVYQNPMPKEIGLQVIALLRDYDVCIDAFLNGTAYVEEETMNKLMEFPISEAIKEYFRNSRIIIENLSDYIQHTDMQIEKMTLNFNYDETGELHHKKEVLEVLQQVEGITVVSGAETNLEITKSTATKGRGLLELGHLLGIEREHIMACGDSENDIEMIREAGIGVAMANATEEVKKEADYITRSNQENGVAYAVKKLVGLKHIIWSLFLFLFFCIAVGQPVQAAKSSPYVRVGLTNGYSQKSKISIKNTKVSLGYCMNNIYTKEANLESAIGFSMYSARGYYYISKNVYRTYASAKKMVKKLRRSGVSAHAGIVYKNTWKIYIGGSRDKSKVKSQYNKIKGKYGIKYTAIQSDNNYRMKLTGKGVRIIIDVNKKKAYPQLAARTANADRVKVMKLGSKEFRGRIEIGRYQKSTLTAVNVLTMDEYLYGVLPKEMVTTWHIEALKAQAVCSRSFAYIKSGYRGDSDADEGYILCDTTHCQVYGGYEVEKKRTNEAVNATTGKRVWYNGKVVPAYFFSTSGGATETMENVWGGSSGYLQSIPDLYENEPEKAPWIIKMSKTQIQAKLKAAGINVGTVLNLKAVTVSSSGRITRLRINGSKKDVILKRQKGREILGLPGNKYKIVVYGNNPDNVTVKGSSSSKQLDIAKAYVISGNGDMSKMSSSLNQYIVMSGDNRTGFARTSPSKRNVVWFVGQGYGHGVGMSQSGARGLAKAGWSYIQILQYYFKGVAIK